MNILFTASGRRVEIIQLFKNELPGDEIFTADVVNTAPGLYVSQNNFVIPSFKAEGALEQILKLCRKYHIDLIIPLIDPEVDFYAAHQNEFLREGIRIMVSDYDAVKIARNKWLTYKWCVLNDLPCAQTVESIAEVNFKPIIAKSRFGSASQGVFEFSVKDELEKQYKLSEDYIFQEQIFGEEITVDVCSDGTGALLASCQRLRLKIRSGEVERAVTMYNAQLQLLVQQIVRLIKPFGFINIQFFMTSETDFILQEMNMRLGGGCPLSYQAGINIPRLVKALFGSGTLKSNQVVTEQKYMLRFDQAFYLDHKELISE